MEGKKEELKFNVGSAAFFEGYYDDYMPHDRDYFYLSDNNKEPFLYFKLFKTKEEYFIYRYLSKEDLLKHEFEGAKTFPMVAGKLLVPDICKYFGITLDDLKQFEDVFNNMDYKHQYEKIIYDAYMANNDITLTKEQRDAAYESYKQTRLEENNITE